MRSLNERRPVLAAVAFLAFLCCVTASADPVTDMQAENVVMGWRVIEPAPLGASLGDITISVDTYFDDQGAPLYYVVYLAPEGFVIVPADDWIEPIIAFAPSGYYDPSPDNPLGALVTNDMKSRMAEVRREQSAMQAQGVQSAPVGKSASERGKWARFSGETSLEGSTETSLPTVSDPRVDPLVLSKWDQLGDRGCDDTTYNYYTPSNYPSGCVATAMSQLMRYHQFPTAGPGTLSYTISICGASEPRTLLGGDGSGGDYDWANMPLDPNCPNDTQRQAIGALCHDAGVAVNMD